MGMRVVEEEGLQMETDSSSSTKDYSMALVHGATCIDKILRCVCVRQGA